MFVIRLTLPRANQYLHILVLINKEAINLGDVGRSLSGSKPTGTQRISNNFLSFCDLSIEEHNVFSLQIFLASRLDVGADLILF